MDEKVAKIHQLRREIDKLKRQIRELSDESERLTKEKVGLSACVGCRHDEIASFMVDDLELNKFLIGITLRGGMLLKEDRTPLCWWTTTIRLTRIEDLDTLVRDIKNLYTYLDVFHSIERLRVLRTLIISGPQTARQLSAHLGIDLADLEETLHPLRRVELVLGKQDLFEATVNGWEAYVTLVHLAHNHIIKIPPLKALKIQRVLEDRLGWTHGTLDEKALAIHRSSMEDKMRTIKESGILEELESHGITEREVYEYVLDNWDIKLQRGEKAEGL